MGSETLRPFRIHVACITCNMPKQKRKPKLLQKDELLPPAQYPQSIQRSAISADILKKTNPAGIEVQSISDDRERRRNIAPTSKLKFCEVSIADSCNSRFPLKSR